MKELIIVPNYGHELQSFPLLETTTKGFEVLLAQNGPNLNSNYKYYDVLDTKTGEDFGYEAGALYKSMNYLIQKDSVNNFDVFGLVQDSISLNTRNILRFDSDILVLSKIKPAALGLDSQTFACLEDMGYNFLDLKTGYGVQFNSFLFSRKVFSQVLEIMEDFKPYLPKNKFGSQAWERVWGLEFERRKLSVEFLTNAFSPHPFFSKVWMNRT